MDELIRQLVTEVRGAWRHRWVAMAAAWAVALGGWAAVFALPDEYEATARVYVDTESAIRDFLQGMAVDSDVTTRVAFIRQRLLSRPNLEQVARDTDLDLRITTPLEFEELIEGLRRDIRIESGVPGRRTDFDENLYTIRYQDRSRRTAEAVVRTLLNAFVEDSLAGTLNQPENARQFLEEQVAAYAARLSEAEARLADFKRGHVGMIPGEGGDAFSRLQSALQSRDELRSELQIAQQRRDALLRQIRGTAPVAGDVMTPRGELERRITEAEARLDELLLAYTERHPDVVFTRESIEALQARLAAMEAAGDGDAAASTNPVYQQAQIALNDAEVEIAALRSRLAMQEERVADFQVRLETMPQVEAELSGLTRDYDITRANYEELVQRLEKAKLSGAVGDTGQDVAFRIIDPPLAPQTPVAPNRPLLIVGVLAAALAAGGGLAYLLHLLNPVFTAREEVYEQLQVPVLGSVSMAWTPVQQRRRRAAHWSFGFTLVALVAACGAVLLTYRPLVDAAQRLLA